MLTRNDVRNRLELGNFDEDGLNCNDNWDDDANDNLGVFPLMVCRREAVESSLFAFLGSVFHPATKTLAYFSEMFCKQTKNPVIDGLYLPKHGHKVFQNIKLFADSL